MILARSSMLRFAAAAAVGLLSTSAFAQPVTWTGAADSVNWTNAGNWSPTGVPGPTSDVSIPIGVGPVVVAANSQARSIATASTLRVVGAQLFVRGGGILLSNANIEVRAGGTLIPAGSQSVSGTGSILLRDGSVWLDGAGTVFSIGSGVSVSTDGGAGNLWYNSSLPVTFRNFGVIRAEPGRVMSFLSQTGVDNRGVIEASGTNSQVQNQSGINIVNVAGAEIRALNGAIFGGPVSNSGSLRVSGLNSRADIDAGALQAGGTFVAANQGLIRLSGTITTANLGAFARTTGGDVQFSSLTVNGAGGPPLVLNDAQPITVTGGRLNGVTLGANLTTSSTVEVAGGLNLNGRTIDLASGVLDFRGTQTVAGPGTIRSNSGSLYASDNGTVTLAANVLTTTTATGSLAFWWNSAPPTRFVNLGTIQSGGSGSISSLSETTLENAGTINLTAGSNSFVQFVNSGTVNVSGASTLLTLPAPDGATGGSLSVSNNARVRFTGSYSLGNLAGFTTSSGGAVVLGGTIIGGTLPFAGPAATILDSSVTLNGVTINQDFAPSSAITAVNGLTISNATLGISFRTITITGGLNLANGRLDLTSATADFRGTQSIAGSGQIRAFAGGNSLYASGANALVTIEQGASVIANPNGAVTFWWNAAPPTRFRNFGAIRAMGGTVNVLDGTSLDNRGLIEVGAGGVFTFDTLNSVANLDNATGVLSGGGRWLVRNNAVGLRFPDFPQTNQVAVVRSIGANTSVELDGAVSPFRGLDGANGSALTSIEGTLALSGGRTLNVTGAGGGTLTNSGQIRVGPASRLGVVGNFVQSGPNAVLAFDVTGGLNAPAAPVISVSGSSTLAGTVSVTAAPGFTPTCGATTLLLNSSAAASGSISPTATLPGSAPASIVLQPAGVRLTFATAGSIAVDPQDQLQAPCLGNVQISGGFTNTIMPVRWQKNGVPLSDGPTGTGAVYSGTTSTMLQIFFIQPGDGGSYQLTAATPCGTALTRAAQVVVQGQCACPVDYNGDGVLNVDDISDFVSDYFFQPPVPGPGGFANTNGCSGEPAPYNTLGYKVDFNQDCLVNTDDVSDYITAFFAGC